MGSSSNWGEIHTIGERTLDIRIKGRYLFQHSLKYLSDCHKTAAKLCGFTHTLAIDPSHIGNPDSALVKIALQAHEKECGCEANVTATHVGVEPSVFHEMKPELEIVTIGTDILNAHSPKESAPIESILHFTNILKAMLEMIAE